MSVVMGRTYRHSRDEIDVAEDRRAFADLIFEEIDRRDWWESVVTREKPLNRLSREISQSPVTLTRLLEGKTSTLSEETFRRLGEETGTATEEWRYALRYNRRRPAVPTELTPALRDIMELAAQLTPRQQENLRRMAKEAVELYGLPPQQDDAEGASPA